MKTTNIQENKEKFQLINQLIIYSIIFIILLSSIFFYVIPSFWEISTKKENLYNLVNHFNTISKEWLSFQEFENLKNTIQITDSYTKNLLATLDVDFYESNLLNKTQNPYLIFLDNLKADTVKQYNSPEFQAKKTTLSKLLPTYSDASSVSLDDVVDDSDFINSVENLLDKFNLVSSDGINIWTLMPFDDQNNKKTKNSLIESDVYYFSIPLNLSWTKKDIIDFLHYLENVASIKINADNIDIYKDNFIQSNTWYDYQLAEVDSIKMTDYLDSDTSTINTSEDAISFIKNLEWQEKYNINISVRFYVKWLASYKVQEFVKVTNTNYQTLLKNITKTIKSIDQKNPNLISIFTSLNSLKKYLDTIKTDMDDLSKKAAKRENLWDTYNKANKLSSNIDNISSMFEQQTKLLNSIKK